MRNSYGAETASDAILLAARICLVLLFLIFGWQKLTGFGGTVAYFSHTGVPLPQIAAHQINFERNCAFRKARDARCQCERSVIGCEGLNAGKLCGAANTGHLHAAGTKAEGRHDECGTGRRRKACHP